MEFEQVIASTGDDIQSSVFRNNWQSGRPTRRGTKASPDLPFPCPKEEARQNEEPGSV